MERTARQLTWMLLLLLLSLLLSFGEEEVRLGGAIRLPKGGHGYLSLRAAGSRRDVGSVLALARQDVVNQQSYSCSAHTHTR